MDKKTDTTVKIGENIKQARQKLGLTQAEVATKADLHVNYYARVERGEATATVETLQKIASVLEVTASEILPF